MEYFEKLNRLCFSLEQYIEDHKEEFIYDKFDLFDVRDILTDNATFCEVFDKLGFDTSYFHQYDVDAICRRIYKVICAINEESKLEYIKPLNNAIEKILNEVKVPKEELGMYFIKKGVECLK